MIGRKGVCACAHGSIKRHNHTQGALVARQQEFTIMFMVLYIDTYGIYMEKMWLEEDEKTSIGA